MMKRINVATENLKNWRVVVVVLAALVVFVTTYMLILPAITLDAETAAEQGGIDVSVEEEAADMQDPAEPEEEEAEAVEAEDADAEENDADVVEADDSEADVIDENEAAVEPETAKAAKETSISDGGKTYDVTVTYGEEAGVPEDASLEVTEITSKSNQYDKLMSRTADALGETTVVAFARFFDIKIVNANGAKVEIAAPVEVSIELTDKNGKKEYSDNAQVVHFADGAKKGDVIGDVNVDGAAVNFSADGFSAYAIVDGPDGDVPIGWNKITSLDDLTRVGGIYIGHQSGYYFMNTTTGDSARTGITKTKPAAAYPNKEKAAPYFFESAGTDGKYYVYCLGRDGTTKQYVYNNGNNSLSFTDEAHKTAFTVEVDNNGIFKIHNGSWYWNMQGGANGARFCSWNVANDDNNKMVFWYYEDATSDPYDLSGKTFGLLNWNGGAKGKAMMAEESAGALNIKELTVMTKKDDDTDHLFIPSDSGDIAMWTFEWNSDDKYYVRSNAGGSLKVSADGKLSLVDDSEASLIQVVPGTGTHKGQICLKSGNNTITYDRESKTFTTNGETGTEWMYLAEQSSNEEDDYFMTHSAMKVSVSDSRVTEKANIIVYTRAWNENLKKYEFFAIDHDGTLVPCYESGDSIEWVGGRVNTMLWKFTEYTNDAGKPNGYYELYNVYEEKYLAPQITDGQILSDSTIGLNLTGRTNGKYYSSILAWDDPNYSFAGLKVEDGQIVSCKKSQAMDFYFAIVEDIPVDDELHTVKTVDNTKYGITMKIQDFGTRAEMSGFLGNDDGGAVKYTQPGLLSTNLDSNGYPTATKENGQNLAVLMNNTKNVNHLFIESTYKASGYYEYDSTQNFASLKGAKEGDFTVYKELGSYDSVGERPTLKHGQFFPFNDIEAGNFAYINGRNLYTATSVPLDDDDPRKNEQLYLINNVDCYYGVELEASFIQTPNGEDAWGHDIIYEFTGDDDFWLYVNGELVIDLGGIHSALPGTINFKTGEVKQVNGEGKLVTSTLREIFEKNYRTRNPRATDAQVAAFLAEYFEGDSTVFKTYSTNTMRIFYMERGAGAANLHMRFNLASVKQGTVELSKKLGNVDNSETILAEFPYQIRYRIKDLTTGAVTPEEDQPALVLKDSGDKHPVLYKDTITPVPYKETLTVDGITYNDVYMLKPDEAAEIDFPTVVDLDDKKEIIYDIVECGVNTDVYKEVKVNNETISGTAIAGHNNRKDYAIEEKTTGQRARVMYTNVVDENALRTLTFSKKLFKEDGVTPLGPDDDETRFEFRLYLGTEFADNPVLANMHTYHVKDEEGNYCKWIRIPGTNDGYFESIGKDDYSELTDDEKVDVSFTTSINGTIEYIPVNYTVEVREVLAGTTFGVQERPWNIPDGYSFQKYLYSDDYPETAPAPCPASKIRNLDKADCVTDVAVAGKDPHVDICNLKGWGLRVNKTWSDQDYMSDRDATYFAVFTKDSAGHLTLVGSDDTEHSTVRQMAYNEDPKKQTMYWYFQHLPVQGVTDLDDYEIREVTLSAANPTVGSDSVVTNYGTVTPIDHQDVLELSGQQKGESTTGSFRYTVLYKKGQIEEGANVRVDKVTNNRPGIVLKKTTWAPAGEVGEALEGATFDLDTASDHIGTFTSDEDGEITVAFLSDEVAYTLTETETPQSYHGLETPMTITLNDGTVTVDGVDEDYYVLDQGAGKTPTLTIKNRPYEFKVVKKDRGSKDPLADVTFALYKKMGDGSQSRYDLVDGYDNLKTDEDGIVPKLDNTLAPGSYELREKEAKEGYEALPFNIRFTVSKTGAIALDNQYDGVELNDEQKTDGTISYEMEILNSELKKVSFKKVDIADSETPLAGAKFDLYKGENGRPGDKLYSNLTSGEDGMLKKGSQTKFTLESGTYYLVETEAPSGYIKKDDPVLIEVKRGADTEDADFGTVKSMNGISYDEGTDLSHDGRGIQYRVNDNHYTLKITNSSGVALPSSGGMGTTLLYLLGGLMMLLAGAGLVAKRRGIL